MEIKQNVLRDGERAMFALRALYSQYGYSRFKMSKFEEYDLYAHNKNFLRGDKIITFTGSGGRLMALRPDVTLSIVKNVKGNPPSPVKVYYNENVYREARDSHELCEILQTGLECIGDIDLYQTAEVILLATRSLETIRERYILDISHMGFLSGLLDETEAPDTVRAALIRAIREKNAHEVSSLCRDAKVKENAAAHLSAAASLYGNFSEALPVLRSISPNETTDVALTELQAVYTVLSAAGYEKNIHFDFSIINDMSYYNGITMNGFIEGIPSGILSGGRYDPLLSRMGKSGGAIGFAVYLDLLERYGTCENPCDADILLLYDAETDAAALIQAVRMLAESGKTVRAEKTVPENFRYRQLLRMKDRGLEILENRA